ncbi:phosphonate ABC transporter ATP-binding protein [Sporocytophaga myxococcoides]|uniref:Cell division ATP-binding protein FtsE n=1 Tax=Sporocytophaga myxococcoides TaxID=153721 RepID=A0A098LF71_9BACT|nr:ATP-binding cassette domain-containing protein [Sporocytophaga myxococcoides]GAL85099.1 phosphonate ABC transporter ATP-binding protein [Sporocytophaga myxococcoides]
MAFSSEPVVSVKDLSIYQEDKLVLDNITFDINKGEFVYLIGRTGSGKSSLLKSLYADLPFEKGKIYVAGYDLSKTKRSKIPYLRRKIGIIFQDFQLLHDRNISDNLLFVMKATGWKDNAAMKARLSEVLMRVGLGAASFKLPHQLSGGEQQRIVIARALINEPLILFADEPTGNLDPEVAEEIFNLFKEINNSGTAVLMATHNYELINKFPNRILKIKDRVLLDSKDDLESKS